MAMTKVGEATGRCLCGAVELRLTGTPVSITYCHCESCRRATGSPAAVLVGFKLEQVAYPKEKPRHFASSAGRDRPFCPHCGSRIGFADERLAGRIYLHIGVLDQPERFAPTCHAFDAERLPWLQIDDDLPRFPTISVPRD
jgi:hypothetical protein